MAPRDCQRVTREQGACAHASPTGVVPQAPAHARRALQRCQTWLGYTRRPAGSLSRLSGGPPAAQPVRGAQGIPYPILLYLKPSLTRAAGFTVPNYYFQASLLGTANNFLVNASGYLACFTPATAAAVQQYGAGSCPADSYCMQMVSDGPPYADPAYPYTNGNDQFFYWRGAPAGPAPRRAKRQRVPAARGRDSAGHMPNSTNNGLPSGVCGRACLHRGVMDNVTCGLKAQQRALRAPRPRPRNPAWHARPAGWGSTGRPWLGIGSGDTHYVDGPYLHSNDTTGAYAGRALNASCTWLGRNQNVTAGGQLVYQRAFQCMEAQCVTLERCLARGGH